MNSLLTCAFTHRASIFIYDRNTTKQLL